MIAPLGKHVLLVSRDEADRLSQLIDLRLELGVGLVGGITGNVIQLATNLRKTGQSPSGGGVAFSTLRVVGYTPDYRKFLCRGIAEDGTTVEPDIEVNAFTITDTTNDIGTVDVRECKPNYIPGMNIRTYQDRVHVGTAGWITGVWTLDTLMHACPP